jgi:hypothetical protein
MCSMGQKQIIVMIAMKKELGIHVQLRDVRRNERKRGKSKKA